MSHLNILKVVQNESFGDRGETTTRAVYVGADMSLKDLADTFLTRETFGGGVETNPDAYLVIRLAGSGAIE